MRTFDVTLQGYDAETDSSDHLVKWVRAENQDVLERWLVKCGLKKFVMSITEVEWATNFEDGVDVKLKFVMPDPGESVVVKNFGDFFQITPDDFDPQEWAVESNFFSVKKSMKNQFKGLFR